MSMSFTRANNEAITLGTLMNLPGTNDELTIDAWVKRGTSADQRVIDKSSATVGSIDWNLGVGGSNQVKFVMNGNTLEAGAVVKSGVWCHIAGTYDGGITRMETFANAVSQGTTSASGNVPNSTRPVRIGSTGFNSTLRNWQGDLYRIRVWNRALTANEIKSLFEALGADTLVDGLFYEHKGTEGAAGTDIGAGVIVNSGPEILANGSGEGAGASLPSWQGQDLQIYP